MKLNRPAVETRSILLRGRAQVEFAHGLLANLPLDDEHPVELLIREQVKKRKLSLNDAMWAGPLRDIERQAWIKGRQYKADIWHRHFKDLFLPDENAPDFDPSHVVEGYKKWEIDPWSGDRMLVGSTTQLTDKGIKIYILQIEAEASQEYGVEFTARPLNISPGGR